MMRVQFSYACVLITSACNMTCRYCYREGSKNTFLDPASIHEILSKLKELGIQTINFSGGEPLLHPNVKEFIDLAYNMGFAVILSTNAILLDLDDPVFQKVNTIVIPIEGASIEVHAQVRDSFQYTHVRSIIDQYTPEKYPFRLKVNSVLTSFNRADIFSLAEYLSDKPIAWRVFFCKEHGQYNHILADELISAQEFSQVIMELDERYPGLLMKNTCLEDVQIGLPYTLINADGEMVLHYQNNRHTICKMTEHTAQEIFDLVESAGNCITYYHAEFQNMASKNSN